MNYVPRMNRRTFVVSAAAAGGGLALGLDIPLGGPQPILAQDGSPELGVWVVIKPDDTVVVRIARSEMGQGTITGLAQLVAEELECDWSKVTTEYPTPGQSVARKRPWGSYSTGGSRGIRELHEYVRKGGATAREMLIQAAANEWKVAPIRMQRVEQRHHAQAVRPHHDLWQGGDGGGQARAAEGGEAQGSEGLEDRRQVGEAARHRRQGDRQAGLRVRSQAARHAQCRDQGVARSSAARSRASMPPRCRACPASRKW